MAQRTSSRTTRRGDTPTADPTTARRLTTRRADACATDALRGDALQILSHELRTPVTVILGAAAIMERRAADADAVADLASDILQEADRLDRLVGNLLVLADGDVGESARPERIQRSGAEPVLVQRLLPAVADMQRRVQAGIDVRVLVEADLPAVGAEAADVVHVLRNLVDNARRYDPAAGGIDLRARRVDDEVVVEVLDRGVGLEAGEERRVFELFYRAPSTATWTTGGGIGLYACAVLVRRMGGRIWARRRPAGGTAIGFSLPVIQA